MTIQLPRLPSAERFRTDPEGFVRELVDYLARLSQELEREARQASTPAKAVFAVTNIAAPTTTLDGATATLPDVVNFLAGLHNTLLAKGFTRTKAGAE